jgi:hypothetical protein
MTRKPSDDALDRALDAALSHALVAPDLPAGFRARVQAALTRAAADGADGTALAQLRQGLESEQQQRLAELQEGYLRVRRRTLAALVVGAFAAGAVAAVAMPWLTSHIGPSAPLVMSAIGASMGLAVALVSWIVRPGVPLRAFAGHKGQS